MVFFKKLFLISFFLAALKAEAQTADYAEAGNADTKPQTGQEDDSPARAAFEQGKTFYAEGKFSQAVQKFREANALRPSWRLYFNIGQSETAAKQYGLALEAFEKYLSLGGDEIPDERREMVLAEIAKLRPIVGFLDVEAPEGAIVLVDGMERGKAPIPGPVMVTAGVEHEILIQIAGDTLLKRAAQVSGGQTIKILASNPGKAEPISSAQDAPSKSAPPPVISPTSRSPLVPVGWAAVGVGAALLVSGAITGALALSNAKDLEEKCPHSTCADNSHQGLIDRVGGLSLATDILLPSGGVIAVAGVVMVLVGRKKGRQDSSASIRVSPLVAHDQWGLSMERSF